MPQRGHWYCRRSLIRWSADSVCSTNERRFSAKLPPKVVAGRQTRSYQTTWREAQQHSTFGMLSQLPITQRSSSSTSTGVRQIGVPISLPDTSTTSTISRRSVSHYCPTIFSGGSSSSSSSCSGSFSLPIGRRTQQLSARVSSAARRHLDLERYLHKHGCLFHRIVEMDFRIQRFGLGSGRRSHSTAAVACSAGLAGGGPSLATEASSSASGCSVASSILGGRQDVSSSSIQQSNTQLPLGKLSPTDGASSFSSTAASLSGSDHISSASVAVAPSALASAAGTITVAEVVSTATPVVDLDSVATALQGAKNASSRNYGRLLWELSKGRLTIWVCLSALPGYFIAAPTIGAFNVATLFIGTGLCSTASQVANQLIEVEYDREMKRTQNRPLVRGAVSETEAKILTASTLTLGTTLLAIHHTPMAAAVAVATFGSYVFWYTPMKRLSCYNTHVGAIAGALPTCIGFAAALPPSSGILQHSSASTSTEQLLVASTELHHFQGADQGTLSAHQNILRNVDGRTSDQELLVTAGAEQHLHLDFDGLSTASSSTTSSVPDHASSIVDSSTLISSTLSESSGILASVMDSPWLPHCLFFFGFQALWQMPHFYSLAWLYAEDYKNANFKMFCLDDPTGEETAKICEPWLWAIFAYPLVGYAASVVPWMFILSTTGSTIFWWRSFQAFKSSPSKRSCRSFFKMSLLHLLSVIVFFQFFSSVPDKVLNGENKLNGFHEVRRKIRDRLCFHDMMQMRLGKDFCPVPKISAGPCS
ncbi:unnamed protein product [Amoebophrya sp. A25]|nr:unnamed protein product [Amoebophrya sp. A25]|eukprot:GSA25T00010968001.1